MVVMVFGMVGKIRPFMDESLLVAAVDYAGLATDPELLIVWFPKPE